MRRFSQGAALVLVSVLVPVLANTSCAATQQREPDPMAAASPGSAASIPPPYARDTEEAPPMCAFDADCDDGDLCDHGQCMAWWRMKGDVPEVDAQTLYWQVERGEVQVLDVRTRAEFGLGRISGAIHVPIQTLEHRLEPGGEGLPLDPNKPVVAICLTAHRSIAAVRLLRRHGYDAVQLQGGMTRWARERLPVVRGREGPKRKQDSSNAEPKPHTDDEVAGTSAADRAPDVTER